MSDGKKSERRKKKGGARKKWAADKIKIKKKERRDTCLLRKRREEIDVPLEAPYNKLKNLWCYRKEMEHRRQLQAKARGRTTFHCA